MRNMINLAIIGIAAIIILGLAVVAYSFLRTPEEASAPIEAIPLADTNSSADQEETAPKEVEATPTSEPVPTATVAELAENATTSEPESEDIEAEIPANEVITDTDGDMQATTDETETIETNADDNNETIPEEQPASEPTLFEIVPAESEARFMIDEILLGEPFTVVGITDQVAGQISIDPNDLSTAQVGVMQVNARTLATDNQYRNRAIKNRILLTDEYEFVTFTPTTINDLPETGVVGESYTFQVVGDLTVTNVTQSVTFDVTATATTETRLEGLATTAFLYTDFKLFIPDSQSVDTVFDEVRLEIEFVAAGL